MALACAGNDGKYCTEPAPAMKIVVKATVAAQLRDRASSPIGTRRMRRTRSSNDPPVAARAIDADAARQVSSSASAWAYPSGSPQSATAMSSQQCSRSTRIRFDTHQTPG